MLCPVGAHVGRLADCRTSPEADVPSATYSDRYGWFADRLLLSEKCKKQTQTTHPLPTHCRPSEGLLTGGPDI
jgi:hypothetical protein